MSVRATRVIVRLEHKGRLGWSKEMTHHQVDLLNRAAQCGVIASSRSCRPLLRSGLIRPARIKERTVAEDWESPGMGRGVCLDSDVMCPTTPRSTMWGSTIRTADRFSLTPLGIEVVEEIWRCEVEMSR